MNFQIGIQSYTNAHSIRDAYTRSFNLPLAQTEVVCVCVYMANARTPHIYEDNEGISVWKSIGIPIVYNNVKSTTFCVLFRWLVFWVHNTQRWWWVKRQCVCWMDGWWKFTVHAYIFYVVVYVFGQSLLTIIVHITAAYIRTRIVGSGVYWHIWHVALTFEAATICHGIVIDFFLPSACWIFLCVCQTHTQCFRASFISDLFMPWRWNARPPGIVSSHLRNMSGIRGTSGWCVWQINEAGISGAILSNSLGANDEEVREIIDDGWVIALFMECTHVCVCLCMRVWMCGASRMLLSQWMKCLTARNIFNCSLKNIAKLSLIFIIAVVLKFVTQIAVEFIG